MNSNRQRLYAVCPFLILAAAALGQDSKPLNLSIRLGKFEPAFSSARDEGKSWFAIGADTRIKTLGVSSTNPGTSSYLTVSFDSYSKGDFRAMPILLNFVTRTNELYFSAGAGLTFAGERNDDEGDKTRIGFALGVGYDFVQGRTPLFVEAKYFGNSSNDHLNGFAIYLGVRL